jgi:hypothetical protein
VVHSTVEVSVSNAIAIAGKATEIIPPSRVEDSVPSEITANMTALDLAGALIGTAQRATLPSR